MALNTNSMTIQSWIADISTESTQFARNLERRLHESVEGIICRCVARQGATQHRTVLMIRVQRSTGPCSACSVHTRAVER